MAACERCWDDAFLRSLATPESQVEAYHYLLAVRDSDPIQRAKCDAYNAERAASDMGGDEPGPLSDRSST